LVRYKGDSEGSSHYNKKFEGKKEESTQGIGCHYCFGFGHVNHECPNYNYKTSKGKAMNVTLSDKSADDLDQLDDKNGNFMALTVSFKNGDRCTSVDDTFDRGESFQGDSDEVDLLVAHNQFFN
jgi:hypothetical protein